MQMQELARIPIYRLLQLQLRRTITRRIADPSRSRVVLRETVHQAFAGAACVGDLRGGGRVVGVLEGEEELLEFGQQEADAALELQEGGVGAGEGGDWGWGFGEGEEEVAVREERFVAFFAEADVEGYGVVGGCFLCE